MAYRQAKYCMDVDRIRWTLLGGVITRKGLQDGPTEGKELPIQHVTGVEKVTVKRAHRSRWGWPVTLFAVALLALAAWTASFRWVVAIPGLVIGLLCLYWGVRRILSRTEVLDAYQIVAPGRPSEDWLVVGSISEVVGFIEGVKAELKEKEAEAEHPVGS